MKMSSAGLAALKAREGCKLVAYLDSAKIPTIGYGSTSGVRMGMKITQAQADALLVRDLSIFEKAVNASITVPLNQNEFDALVSFAFNIGAGAFQKSTLLKELNKGNRYGAANEFLKWDKAGGKKLKGLTKRREAERAQFLSKKEAVIPVPTPKPVTIERAPVPGGNWLARLLEAILSIFRSKK